MNKINFFQSFWKIKGNSFKLRDHIRNLDSHGVLFLILINSLYLMERNFRCFIKIEFLPFSHAQSHQLLDP